MSKRKKKLEFSKIIFISVMSMYVIVSIFSMALMWKTDSTDPLVYLIPSISGIMATVISTYMWKARTENRLKLARKYKMDIEKIDDDVESEEEL